MPHNSLHNTVSTHTDHPQSLPSAQIPIATSPTTATAITTNTNTSRPKNRPPPAAVLQVQDPSQNQTTVGPTQPQQHNNPIVPSLHPTNMKFISITTAALLLAQTEAFSVSPSHPSQTSAAGTSGAGRAFSPSPLFMGRAAAVRAATKSKTDAKKAKINAVYGKKIIMAVKSGGSPDPNANRGLADVIKQAKANNVPVDNINRAIKRASEATAGDFSESTFEAYGFGGASMVINVLSDNANRASADVKSTVNKRSGKIAEQGSVLFMYDRKGKVEVAAPEIDEEALLELAIEADIEDFAIVEVRHIALRWVGLCAKVG
mmetsp:Transcript_21843/g.60823  ORF Transcript_21843/g.60823 Transcript_21843/m.60823 type:complete len:318 (-) Transcript_21843:838-1791(-)